MARRSICPAGARRNTFLPSIARVYRLDFGQPLFGHRTGAFTGAIDNQEGAFEARKGHHFRDEIGDISLQFRRACACFRSGKSRDWGNPSLEKSMSVRGREPITTLWKTSRKARSEGSALSHQGGSPFS